MFMEFQFEDIVFGIFPKVGGEMTYAFRFWPDNSVGDIIDMLMQMLEVSFVYVVSQFSFIYLKALEFIHDLNIAHRVLSILLILKLKILNNPCDFCRMHSMIILLPSGIQSHCAR